MPIVPGEFVQSVMPQGQLAYQHIHAKPDEFGAQMAHTLELAGRRLDRDAIERIDGTNVNDVYANQFDPAYRGIYQNFLRLGGKEAAEQLPAVKQQMMDLAAQTSAALPNDYQRSLFNQMSSGRISSDLVGMARHAAASLDQWSVNTDAAISDAAARRIGDNIYDFDRVAGPNGLINGIRRMSEAKSALDGIDRSVSDLQAAGSIDKGLSDAILNEAQSNPTGAKLLYDRYAPYMSSDPVRQHVLDNLLPAVRQEQNTAVYNDVLKRFNLTGLSADSSNVNAAIDWVKNPENYKDQLTGPDQRNDMAMTIQGAWNRARQFHQDNQSSADSNFTDAVASGQIAGIRLQTWKDPKTGLAPSADVLRAAIDRSANPDSNAPRGNADVLAGIARGISDETISDAGPINQAYLQNQISSRDFKDLTGLYNTYQDPAKSRWFDYARDAFNSKYADPNRPNGVDAEAMKLFPSFMMDLNGAIRDQDLNAIQARDLTNKMLDDVGNLLPAAGVAASSPGENPGPFGLWVARQLEGAGKVVSDDTIKAAGEKLAKLHPDIEKDYRNINLEF